MAFAPLSTYHDCGDGSCLGRFREQDTGNLFEYSENNTGQFPEWPHLVWVSEPQPGVEQGFRYARVMKTRALLWVDEDCTTKWFFRSGSHREYVKY